jgi:serine/threonine-protein kinase
VITLTLLHPIQSIPVQNWSFEQEPVIRIGRSTDNHVILYSAVVSRHHVELRQVGSQWEIVNLGANGTYLDGKRITQVPIQDGVIIRLARSGPNIQIHIGPSASTASQTLAGENTVAQRIKSRTEGNGGKSMHPAPAREGALSSATNQLASESSEAPTPARLPATVVDEEGSPAPELRLAETEEPTGRLPGDPSEELLFCQNSGQPLRVLKTLVEYQVVKTLKDDGFGVTQVVWRNGQSLLLKTLSSAWVNQPRALEIFQRQAKPLLQLSHPGIPRFIDYFSLEGHPYLITEWVHGQDLSQRVAKQGPLSKDEAIATLLQVCDVLDYLHHQSPPFIHQNIQPESLIQRPSAFNPYTIAVVGFASLNELAIESQLAASGYLAPEQKQGHPIPASDLYALGTTLVYLLTGKDPSEFYAHREQGFRLYPEYIPNLAPGMVTIIRKLTSPHPDDRYRNAGEVAEALGQLIES